MRWTTAVPIGAVLLFACAAVPADIVPHSRATVRMEFDLSGLNNSTLLLDFAALVNEDPGGFGVVSTTGSNARFQRGFFLTDFVTGPGAPDGQPGPGGFYAGGAWVFQRAYFNLAAYDGQMIALTISAGAPESTRFGQAININNLSIDVAPAGGVTQVVVPEPPTFGLALIALLGYGYWQARRTGALVCSSAGERQGARS